ncbi:1-phosphatidylinositol 3-phosphate 5-kinase [Schistocerca piceifrons]|uniref:1-phosphatidylinositol 3-phosphate 5-kinase n=1 Tax=Schistocerca piceifrons TaxID=274613 RepID=UPI001F5FE047|nr:1-phosphatidylinositol 3-phosphate 5-kinase [Schistocerca piceifrons]
MNKNLESPSKLTEFAPLSPETGQPGVSVFLSKLFKFSRSEATSEGTSSVQTTESQSTDEVSASHSPDWQENPNPEQNSPFTIDVTDGRSLPNVLRRISNLLALKSTGLQSYKDTDLKQYWMPDSVSKECYDCGEKFTTFRRKHHCRVCGQIFCSRCCNQEIPGKIMGCTGDLRVCTYCCKVVLSYLQSADTAADLSADLRLVQEDLQVKFGNSSVVHTSAVQGSLGSSSVIAADAQDAQTARRKTSVGFQEDRFALGRAQGSGYLNMEERVRALQESASLCSLAEELRDPVSGLGLHTHRYRLRNYRGCFLGSELVDWLLARERAGTRSQATAIGQALIEGNFLECVSEQYFIDGYALYRHLKQEEKYQQQKINEEEIGDTVHVDSQEPLWVKQIPQQDSATTTDSEPEMQISELESPRLPSSSSSFYLDMNVEENIVTLSRPKENDGEHSIKQEKTSRSACSQDVCAGLTKEFLSGTLWLQQVSPHEESIQQPQASGQQQEDMEKETLSRLENAYSHLESSLLRQLLNSEGLSQSWTDIILPLISRIVDMVKPDTKNDIDNMDIRQYVQFKKVPGGNRQESCIVNGIVCTKNVAHRSMAARLTNPRILLLGCSIVYQRIEGRLLSLEPVMMQEHEYLRNAVARIVALQPDILLVGRGVSRLAQDLLLAQGITLALNVRSSVLNRVARCTKADIVSSVDAHIGRPQLGTCHSFYLRTFHMESGAIKTLMVFEGCPLPHLGCTVLLRGASEQELAKLKRVTSFMTYVRYNWCLERAFLMDEFACPPPLPKDTFMEENSYSGAAPIKSVREEILSSTCAYPKENGKHNKQNSISSAQQQYYSNENMKEICEMLHQETVLSKCVCETIENISVEMVEPYKKTENENVQDFSVKKEFLDTKNISTCTCSHPSNKEKSPPDDRKMNVESISDFSDPLHSYLNLEDDVFSTDSQNGPSLSVSELPLCNRFRKALDDTILSGSPYIKFAVPYLETEAGRNCTLRRFFPEEIFFSEQFCSSDRNANRNSLSANCSVNHEYNHAVKTAKVKPQHPFVKAKLTSPAGSREVQALLAHFRACGGRLPLTYDRPVCLPQPLLNSPTSQQQQQQEQEVIDALHPANHQHISVLFCSYAYESNNAPAFCVNPWIVNMEFYGRNDISLGNFLERYCFRPSYLCPSDTCDTPMLSHVRRFVHDAGCVHVLLKELDQPLPATNNEILMWSWCNLCNTTSPVVPMTHNAWSLSFAKFLELRFHGGVYTRRHHSCQHSLHHDHYLYFGLGKIVASFKYTGITLWEICLPPPVIEMSYNPQQQSNVIEEIKKLALKGYDVYSSILERLCSLAVDADVSALKQILMKEQALYKSRIEEIQLKLTSPTLEAKKLAGKMAEQDVHQLMWHIDDCVVQLKRHIWDVVTAWNARLTELLAATRRQRKSGGISSSSLSLDIEEAVPQDINDTETCEGSTSPCSEGQEVECLSSPSMQGGSDIIDEDLAEDNYNLPPDTVVGTVDVLEGSSPKVQIKMHSESLEDSHDGKSSQKSVKTILSQLLPSATSSAPIQSPLSPQEHHLPPTDGAVPIVVYETEPSSIIAYALSSQDYRRFHDEMNNDQVMSSPVHKRKSTGAVSERDTVTSGQQTSEIRRSGVLSFLRGASTSGPNKGGVLDGVQYTTVAVPGDSVEQQEEASPNSKAAKSQPSQHIEVQFEDASCNFYCRVYFVEQFANLRAEVLPAGEEAYIRSLSRCVQWAARGGKSGSSFCKTRDDRFILKEMSRLEMQVFLEFAPNYFAYMSRCLSSGQPTLLGKILGVYRVVFRNSVTNAALRSNLLVMENLFHARLVTHKFDLKGSVRNRLVNPSTDQEGEIVLLDENLLKMACDSPLYIHLHSKKVLMQAINNDTEFLSSQSVMDYSLLVGLDQEKRELVVGIIDYIRTFTWDKKLETMVKSSGILGGQGKLPTVVSPELYRARFTSAMHRYFLAVPDRWTGLGTVAPHKSYLITPIFLNSGLWKNSEKPIYEKSIIFDMCMKN